MDLRELLQQYTERLPESNDFVYLRSHGLSHPETVDLINRLPSETRRFGTRVALRRIRSLAPNQQLIILTNSPNLMTPRMSQDVTVLVTSLNPVSFSLLLGREELVSLTSWIL